MKLSFKTSHLILIFIFIICGEIFAQWYTFPTYQEYVGYMEKWQADYPQLSKLYDLGPSGLGTHRVYALRISDNVSLNEAEPRYVQTATIHGNALMGYIFSLHMIDTLLSSYGSDGRITELVNCAELWFFPLCHPDATYLGGDSTVMGAKLGIGNIDLNANWPCPCMQGNHKYYGIYDTLMPEVAAIMKVHEMYRFNLHCDMHCGMECVLWPYGAIRDRACDEDWFAWAAKRFVDQVHVDCGNNGYMTSCGGDGIGHCYSWYECHGTRMDFCTRFGQAKGFQLETSIRKIWDEADLRKHWVYDKEALFQYYELLYTGVQGVVTDALTKEPINHVNVTAVGHDYDSAAIFTDSAGFYLRFINTGTYSFTFSHPDYQDTTIEVSLNNYNDKVVLNVELNSVVGIENTIGLSKQFISVIPFGKGVKIVFSRRLNGNAKVDIYYIGGKRIRSIPAVKESVVWDGRDSNGSKVSNGCYIVQVQAGDKKYCRSFMFFR